MSACACAQIATHCRRLYRARAKESVSSRSYSDRSEQALQDSAYSTKANKHRRDRSRPGTRHRTTPRQPVPSDSSLGETRRLDPSMTLVQPQATPPMRDDCRGVSKRESFPTDAVFAHLPQPGKRPTRKSSCTAPTRHRNSRTRRVPPRALHMGPCTPPCISDEDAALLRRCARRAVPCSSIRQTRCFGSTTTLARWTRRTRNHWRSMRTGDTVHTEDAFSRLALPGNHATCAFA